MTLLLAERTMVGVPLSKSSEAFIRNQISQRATNNPSDTLTLLITLILGSRTFSSVNQCDPRVVATHL